MRYEKFGISNFFSFKIASIISSFDISLFDMPYKIIWIDLKFLMQKSKIYYFLKKFIFFRLDSCCGRINTYYTWISGSVLGRQNTQGFVDRSFNPYTKRLVFCFNNTSFNTSHSCDRGNAQRHSYVIIRGLVPITRDKTLKSNSNLVDIAIH